MSQKSCLNQPLGKLELGGLEDVFALAELPPCPSDPNLILSNTSLAKTVTKNWGYEKWLVYENAPFAFKLLFLKTGCRTSLQFHEKKEECMLILSGHVRLHHVNDSGDILTTDLHPGNTVYVKPKAIHRVEAIVNSLYAEVSTTELNDVIRLQDDFGRPSGHIETEHNNSFIKKT